MMVSTTGSEEPAAVRIFISYSHHEVKQKDAIQKALSPLEREHVELWSDDRISLGQAWDDEIKKRIEASHVAVVLVSSEFLASPYCRNVEIAAFLQLAAARRLRIVPIILYDCDWQNERWLAAAQAFPGGERTLFRSFKGKARQAQAFQQLLVRMREVIAEVRAAPPASPKRVASSANRRSEKHSREPLTLDDLFAEDVVTVHAASAQFASLPERAPEIVARLRNLSYPGEIAVRRVLAAAPRETAPLLQQKVLAADRDYPAAQAAASSFSPGHAPFAAEALSTPLRSGAHADIGRMCIESLGFLAAADHSFLILDSIRGKEGPGTIGYATRRYDFDKYNVEAIEALARIFSLQDDRLDGRIVLSHLADALLFADGYSPDTAYMRHRRAEDGLSRGSPDHADLLIDRWLQHDAILLRKLAAHALGQMRLGRAVPHLVRFIGDADAGLALYTSLALGNIGTDDAVEELLRVAPRSPGMAIALEAVHEPTVFRETARDLLAHAPESNTRWRVIRAASLNGHTDFMDDARKLLASTEPADRGHACLAIARLGGSAELPRIRRAYAEAGKGMAGALSAAALFVAGEKATTAVLHRLRRDLHGSWLWIRHLREDVMNALESTADPQALEIREAFTALYSNSGDY